MRNPYAVYKQQTRISENKKAMQQLKEQTQKTNDVNDATEIGADLELVTAETSETSNNNGAEMFLVSNVPGHMNLKDTEQIRKENPYLYNTVMTASPEDLTALLYGGAIKFMKQTLAHMEKADFVQANYTSQRAQAIFEELMCSLDVEGHPEMSKQLYNLYEYIVYSLIQANTTRKPELILQMIEFTNELRTTWQDAVKSLKVKRKPTDKM